jgi:DNA-binding NarL/FixJ family response regulator
VHVHLAGDADLQPALAAKLADAGFTLAPNGAASAGVVVLAAAEVDREWLDDLDEVREAHDAPIVAVIGALPSPYLMRVLVHRVEGAVLLDDAERALGATVHAVLAGQAAHPLAFRDQLERPLLSAREKQVLGMVVLGFANLEIAQKLFVTEASIKGHLTSAFAKLGVHSREAATALILDPDAGYGPGILRITPEEQPVDQR